MNVIYVLTDGNGWLATVRDWGLAERIRHAKPDIQVQACEVMGLAAEITDEDKS